MNRRDEVCKYPTDLRIRAFPHRIREEAGNVPEHLHISEIMSNIVRQISTNMGNNYQSIGLFIDGGYYAKINEALEEHLSLNINVSALMAFIRQQIAQLSGTSTTACHLTESHYFRGRYRVNDANNKHLLYSERKFEDALIENDVIFHYKHLREIQKEGGITVIEKGIDVWFALEAYELSTIRKFDYVVLITGDADHEMLMKKLKALKIHTVLLTWDVSDDQSTSTAKLLRDEACTHLELNKLVACDKELLKKLCKLK